jgi:NitT/TauT family transport system substrate-binding protein
MKSTLQYLLPAKVLTAAFIAVVSFSIPAMHAHAQEKVAIGISNKSLLGLPILIAKEKGFFAKAGLDVSIDYFNGDVPATAALIGGSVQFVDAAFENNVKAVKKGQPVVSIMGLQTDFAGAIIVRKDVADKLGGKLSAESLKHLRIGTLARGGFADVATRYIVGNARLDPVKDVELIPIRGADRQLLAGDAGEIDAAFVMEPWNVIAVDGSKKWKYVVDLSRGEGPSVFQGIGYTTMQTTRAYVKSNRPTAEKVVRAVADALDYIRAPKNLDDVAAIANREYGAPGVDIMKISLNRQAASFSPRLTPAAMEKTVYLLLKSESLDAPAPGFNEVVDVSFAPLWTEARGATQASR